jgi:2-desacetyl-2-hydroxyethyl bacteriochlorophyllide A dehydrogenase
MSGHVAAVGSGVEGLSVGQPVTVMPLQWCGTCPACASGHQHICHRLNFIGIDSPGAMQQLWTVPATVVIPLPEDLSLIDAALVEPAAVAVHDMRRAALRVGEQAVVVGGGPVGVLIALVARSVRAEVVLLELDPHRRAVAEQLGLRTLDPSKQDVAVEINDWTKGSGASVAFEVSGSAAGVGTAVQALAVRGRLVVVGIHTEPRQVDLFQFFWRELAMVGARVYERRDYDTASELLRRGEIPTDVLISRIEPLEHAAAAFAALHRGGDVMKVLIDCRMGG